MLYEKERLREISFPLGGIGAGSIGLGGDGRLIDWEIFNRPNKGSLNGYSHIAVRAALPDGSHRARILQGDLNGELCGRYGGDIFAGYGFGPRPQTMAGFPHFSDCKFRGEYPIATLDFSDAEFPGKVTLTAFNPLIPLDSLHSSMPAAFFEISFFNDAPQPIDYQAAFSLCNPFEKSVNRITEGGALVLADAGENPVGELALACPQSAAAQAYWYRGWWQDSVVTYWKEWNDGYFPPRAYDAPGSGDTGTVCGSVRVEPGESKSVRFVLAWHVPYNNAYWADDPARRNIRWKNYYATVFPSAEHTARYCVGRWDELYGKTRDYCDALFSSSADPDVIDAASASVAALRSPGIFRLSDGTFYGFEGVCEKFGSCEGTCQHVYNYAYALCFLFPDLERSIRNLEFSRCTMPDGQSHFRVTLPLEWEQKGRACVDGQMGCVIKTYREWKLSGDDEWLKSVWQKVKKVLSYAWSEQNAEAWDRDRDGVLEGRQHHTLDMELFGPSSWLQGFYFAALDAAARMAEYLGETELAAEYRRIRGQGTEWVKSNLFNGEYFIQKIDLTDKSVVDRFGCADGYWNEEAGEIKYQVGEGSALDQMVGQWHANLCGLDRVFDKEQTDKALRYMFRRNFKPSVRAVANPWRLFSLNDEAGAIICDYPDGGKKPAIPLTYSEETMSGFEYAFAGLLMQEGFLDEGLTVVRAVRARYRGHNRNPWSEIECGGSYVRSMAAFALLPVLSGFTFDLPKGRIGFRPLIPGDFSGIWSTGTGWGKVRVRKNRTVINLYAGTLSLSSLALDSDPSARLFLDGKPVPYTLSDGALCFARTTVCDRIEILS